MLELQEDIAKAYAATERLRRDLAKSAQKEYFQACSGLTGNFDAARTKAASALKSGLLTAETLSVVSGGAQFDEKSLARLALSFDVVAAPLQIPPPPVTRDPKVFTLALAALAGAFAGALGLSPLLGWAFDARELGVVLGGPLGAFLGVLVLHRLSRIRALLRFLPWRGRQNQPAKGYRRKEYENVVRASIEQWLEWAVLVLAALCADESASTEPHTSREVAFRHIGKLIYTLHGTRREALPVVADELIKEAKNCGFEGLEGTPAFAVGAEPEPVEVVWTKTLQNKYETFGHVDEGDRVTVERPPVVFSGKVVERGLVRKVRDQA
ncbi:MAG: hypothetical protein JW993_09480 [Sedimentisphaerales bacterium]|nr:hypothetical protein [Sedimentisphaerales bacterium]